jgi:hypothetical protein
MAASRFTITLRLAMRNAPRASVTVVIIGSNLGVRPTASATAKSSESRTGRPKATRSARTAMTRAIVSRATTRPNARRSFWNGDDSAAWARDAAAAPNTVAAPVAATRATASPVCATAPRNRAFDASAGLDAAMVPGNFSTG